MKKQTLLFLLCLPFTGVAQGSQTWHYLEVKYSLGGFGQKQKVEIDTGEDVTGWFKTAKVAQGDDGKDLKFKTAIDALNHFGAKGWELVGTYIVDEPGLSNLKIQHYILKHPE